MKALTSHIIIWSSYIVFLSLPKLAESALHIISLCRPVSSITCTTPWGGYTSAYTLQCATGNPSTIDISVDPQVLLYGWDIIIVVTRSPRGTVFDEPTGSNPRSCGWESDALTIRPSQTDNRLMIIFKAIHCANPYISDMSRSGTYFALFDPKWNVFTAFQPTVRQLK